MTKLPLVLVIYLTLGCVCSYYYQYAPAYQPNVLVRHHVQPFVSPSVMNPAFHPGPYARVPVTPYHGMQQPFPAPAQVMYNTVPYTPAASYQQSNYYPFPQASTYQPQRSPRFSFYKNFDRPFYGAYSQHMSKPSLLSKLKPFLFSGGGMGKSQYPYHPNSLNMHAFPPSRPFHMPAPVHHQYMPAFHHPAPHMPTPYQSPQQERSCSCSLHVGEITVYRHTDVRSSYSCSDLTDCKNFCTNLFSSEDLRAQTRADACLLMGRDGSFPWFRRDQVCHPYGVKNDTALSVDLCCKDLQAC